MTTPSTSFIYNDTEFTVQPAGNAWDITRRLADGSSAMVGSNLFTGLTAEAAFERAHVLIKTAYPVGVKTVGPDVAHPNLIGDLKIVGPDVSHANFVNWDQGSTSFPSTAPAAQR